MLTVPRFSHSQNRNTTLNHRESRHILDKLAFEHSGLEIFKSMESLTDGSLTAFPSIFSKFKLISTV